MFPVVTIPLYDVPAAACVDDRYPALAGEWLAWCSPTGAVDRATHVLTRETVALHDGARSPGLGPAVVYATTPAHGIWRLPSSETDPDATRVVARSVGPPATDGAHAAVALEDHVEVFALTERTRRHTPARPLPWYGTALAWPWAAWVQAHPTDGEDVWARTPDGEARLLAGGPGDQRHVAGSGRWLAWVGPDGVHVHDTVAGDTRSWAADTGFHAGLGLWGPVACWEERAALRDGSGDIDIRCSDGVEIRRPGDQLWPSRWGPWLVYREGGRTMLATVAELELEPHDPRATGDGRLDAAGRSDAPVRWTFDWPAPGWRFDRWDGAAWVPGGPLGVGTVTVENPDGDAVRLRRGGP